MPDPEVLLRRLRSSGPSSALELQKALGLNRSAFFRLAQLAGPGLLRYGKTRAARYAALRSVPGVDSRIPLFFVNPEGQIHPLGTLHPVEGGGTVVEWANGRTTEHPGVPWFLDDARPQGFLGRAFARMHHDLGLGDLGRWREDDTLRALALRGEDLPGDIVVGDLSLQRFYERFSGGFERPDLVRAANRLEEYPGLAVRALHGDVAGSSAAGEQPKFTAAVEEGGAYRHVIVKFSPPLEGELGRRWADLLACEYLALEHLRTAGLPAAQAEILESKGRFFLEVTRFDRQGKAGRRPVVSLATVDAELIGVGVNHWAAAAVELERQKRLSTEDTDRVRQLEAFGRLILNTDRHPGNLSVFWSSELRFQLAPIYDMLPMAFAPIGGQVVDRAILAPRPDSTVLQVWLPMRQLALTYWEKVRQSPLISSAFKSGAASAALRVLESLP